MAGVAEKINTTSLKITELPIHKWTENFKTQLENMISGADKWEATVKVRSNPRDDSTCR